MIVTCQRVNCRVKFDRVVPWQKYCSKECKLVDWSLKKLNKKKRLTKPLEVLK